jgi:AcrR family transcriptional regulator
MARMTAGEAAEPDRRQRILGATFDLFVERGYAGTTTQHIAARARVSKRDLYALFADKAAIMAACIAGRSAQMSQPLRLPTPPDRAALEASLAAFGASLMADLSQPSTIAAYRLAITEAERAPEVARLLHASGRMVVRQAAVDLLRGCAEAGLVAGDPAAMADLFFATLRLDGLLLHRLLGEELEPEAQSSARAAAAARAVLAASAPR